MKGKELKMKKVFPNDIFICQNPDPKQLSNNLSGSRKRDLLKVNNPFIKRL